MRKLGALLLVFLLTIVIISAQDIELTVDENAYSCLESKVSGKCSALSFEEQVFSLLALSYNSDIENQCMSALKDNSENLECWPEGSCNIRDTALAMLALNNIGDNVEKQKNWLLDKKQTPVDVEWFLEIDSSGETDCTITADTSSSTISINEDKKMSGSTGTCLAFANDNYWLKVQASCIGRQLTISCNKDFITTMIYKEEGSNVWHVSSSLESASAGGQTTHEVGSFCLADGDDCDYEGNLWAALALQKTGYDIANMLPYLITSAENNNRYFPSAFLYELTNSEDYLQEILSLQKDEGYWDLVSGKGKFYDSALALLSIAESNAQQLSEIWLTNEQETDGCWNNGDIRDTAFILWATWPRTPVMLAAAPEYCEDFGYYCMSKGACDEAGGSSLSNFICYGLEVCCDKPQLAKTCSEEGGIICPSGQQCSISTISASDTSDCCLGDCMPELSECEDAGYLCRAQCLDDETTALLDCPDTDVCCRKEVREGGYFWLWFLLVLIILVVLGIIFRNRLRVLIFKIRSRFRKGGPVTKTRPAFPPAGAPGRFRKMVSRVTPRQPYKPAPRKPARKESEFEETLRKLREMGK